jgi:hypothetical protein
MSDLHEFDDILEDEVVEPQVEIVEEAAAEPEQETPETEPESEEVVEESKVETTATEKEPWTLSAVLDEREKRQAAVKRAEELEAKLKAYEKTEPDVSIFEDEQGFIQRQKQETEVALRNTALNMSEAFAESVYGEEKVAAAKQWMINEGIKSPYALEQFNAAKLPYHAAVKLYEDDQARRDPEAYKAKLREEILAELQEKQPKPSTPSLASKRSVGDAHKGHDDFQDILGD